MQGGYFIITWWVKIALKISIYWENIEAEYELNWKNCKWFFYFQTPLENEIHEEAEDIVDGLAVEQLTEANEAAGAEADADADAEAQEDEDDDEDDDIEITIGDIKNNVT